MTAAVADRPRATSRGSDPVDLNVFTSTVEDALAAFGTDVSYAVAMARAAVIINRKREVWAARRAAADTA